MRRYHWGIDIGSVTVKVVVLDQENRVVAHQYRRSNGKPHHVLLEIAEQLTRTLPGTEIATVGFTGSGGGPVARLLDCAHVNELVAQTRAVGEFYPHARTIIEIGGQDSKFLSVSWDEALGKMVLDDFAMNNLCAAGTGSFLDQQAERLGIAIDEEFANIALETEQPARVAGRCTVFAKSDMIHLQQKGTAMADILAGLCLALSRNYCSVIGKGKAFTPPILFQGGVAYNAAVVKAFEEVLRLKPGELIVPENHHIMAAIGTALLAWEEWDVAQQGPFAGFAPLKSQLENPTLDRSKSMPILLPVQTMVPNGQRSGQKQDVAHDCYLGIDVGSISTNVVALNEAGELLARQYLFTAGQPLEAVRQGLAQIGHDLAGQLNVLGVGVTGSGRYLTGHYVGADVVRNEITAQARAAYAIDPTVDTIFEIGGQDSKYISLKRGAIVDFAMNSACAAGTGSFLQEQADRLELAIEGEFSDLAFRSRSPACLGERCTVFMESDLVHHQQQGAPVTNLTAGLAYSIAQNYLNRVVDSRQIGKNIFFQGGVAWNESVVAAFRQLTGRSITVPPNHDVTGAIGAALLASEGRHSKLYGKSGFKGFFLADRQYESQVFECKQCPNLCEINKVTVSDEAPIYFGARCDIFEEAGRQQNLAHAIPDLFKERTELLLGDYEPPGEGDGSRRRVAIPRALTFYDLFPYWRTFFQCLEIDVVLSPPTTPRILRETANSASIETCLPAKLVFGHVAALEGATFDHLFMPSVVNRENSGPGQEHNVYCPFIQSIPHLVDAHMPLERKGMKLLTFPYFMQWEPAQELVFKQLAETFQLPASEIRRAAGEAARAQRTFYKTLRQRGEEVLTKLQPGDRPVVIIGRPYNSGDPGTCQDLPYKLRKLGALPIPMDYLPLETVDLTDSHDNMFWRSGQDILAAARIISTDARLQAIYLTNFSCGPDSFLLSFFADILGDKPFLELEVDDHTADAGVITRCEAFLESLTVLA